MRFPHHSDLHSDTAPNSIFFEELRSISPEELLVRFCMDTAGYRPEPEEIAAFMETLRAAEREGEQQ